jgi:S-adenosylmethionine synthetase
MNKIEIIERKGIGHPDTIADNLSEELSKKLLKEYRSIYRSPKHYNVDKVMVCAGELEKAVFKKSVKIVFAGQYTKINEINEILDRVVKKILAFEIKNGLKYKVYNFLNQGSLDLKDIFLNKKSNDTSFAVGTVETKNEKLVKKLGFYIDSLHKNFKKIGTDNKIMFIDDGESKQIYIALAFLNKFKSAKEYFDYKIDLESKLRKKFKINDLFINVGDTEEIQFITKTGTSLEMGDSGATGRGNRRNGLITPCRPMTLEAYCGKNDVTHIGKIYQDLSLEIAKKRDKNILLLNKIGEDINNPMIFEI